MQGEARGHLASLWLGPHIGPRVGAFSYIGPGVGAFSYIGPKAGAFSYERGTPVSHPHHDAPQL